MKLLIVEDNTELASEVDQYLSQERFVCESVHTKREALEKLYAFNYDIILLDLMLPDGDGLSLLEIIKAEWSGYGVLIISAKNALDDRVKGLDMGADDYLSKPFHLVELNSRLKSIYRRRHQKGEKEIIFEEISLNTDRYEAYVHSQPMDLTRKEFELLRYFMVNRNRLLTKQAIAEHLWGDYTDSMDSFDFVYQHVKNLRKKIEEVGGTDYLKTIYGAGYKMAIR